MTLSTILEHLKTRYILIASVILAVISILLNLILPVWNSNTFNSIFESITSALVSCLLVLMWWIARRNSFTISHTIKWMAFTLLAWFIGDIVYLYFEFTGKVQFPSIVDFIYIIATLIAIVMLLKIPGTQSATRRWNMILIEISILSLSASVLFAVLLFLPGNPYLQYDFLTLFLVVIYPVLDIILLWIAMVLYFSYPQWRIQKVLGAIFIGGLFLFASDFFYLVNSLYDTMFADFVIDLGYYFFYIWILIAGLYGFHDIRGTYTEPRKELSAFQKGNWIVFLPGILLVVVISLVLVLVISNPVPIFHGIIVLLGIIIVLFLIHQYLVILENKKLTREMKLINQELEITVERRTAELEKTNADLKEEMLERRKTEDELAKTNQELDVMNKDKIKLFSILAHDLRSPLGAMMSLSNLMIESVKDFDEEELLDITGTLNKSATQTFQLLNDLLSWSTAQMGRPGEIKVLFPLYDVVNENITALTPMADEKQIRIFTEITPELIVYADKYAIQTIIRNLLNNAIKFSHHDGIVIVEAKKEAGYIKLSVTDKGLGMSPEAQYNLFRIDSVNSSKGTGGEKGSGFGLLLCKEIIEKNNGTIGFESEAGKGSTFFINLPLEPSGSSLGSDSGQSEVSSSYVIDLSQNIGITTLVGNFTAIGIMNELARIWQNKNYNPEIPAIVDLRKAIFKFDFADMPKLTAFFEGMPGNTTKRKFAMLTTTPQQVAYTTVFKQKTMEKYPIILEIFTTYEGAVNWLKS